MYYDNDSSDQNSNYKRAQSGCRAPNSVCNKKPFSQRLNDPQTLDNPSCDEWPMAETKQKAYALKDHPNSLRCIEQSENSSKSVTNLHALQRAEDSLGLS